MSGPSGRHAARRYELRVEGHLDGHWSAWFGGLALTPEEDGTTTLSGVLADQAELHGLLAKVRDVGATLISFTSDDIGTPGSQEQRRSLSRPPPTRTLSTPQQEPPTAPSPRPTSQE